MGQFKNKTLNSSHYDVTLISKKKIFYKCLMQIVNAIYFQSSKLEL